MSCHLQVDVSITLNPNDFDQFCGKKNKFVINSQLCISVNKNAGICQVRMNFCENLEGQ